jgi:membrane associated rhomboid family serine protease
MTPAAVGLRCPEHSGKPQGIQRVVRPTQHRVRTTRRAANVVTIALVAINVGVYLAELAAGGTVSGTGNWIFEHGALVGPLVGHGDWWRLITAAFLHYGPLHLAMNMYGLYLAGSLLEHVIGSWRFLVLYLASGIAGSAGALLLNPQSFTVGASGAIFGIFGALFVLERARHIATGGQIAGLIVINLILTFAVPNISVGGHVGGLIGGVVLMWLLLEFRNSRNSNVQTLAAAAAVVVISVVIAYLKTRNYA